MVRRSPADPEVDRVLSDLPRELQPIGRRLRALVRANAPELRETVKWGNPMWVGQGNVICLMIFTHHINLGLWRGAELGRKYPQIEGTGKSLRHVKIPTLRAASDPTLVRIIRDAVKLDGSDGGA